MSQSELEFVAEEWVKLAADKALPLGLPDRLLGREFVVQGMRMLTGCSAEQARRTIDEEVARFALISN